MLYTKNQPHNFLGTGEDILSVFYHIWAWRPSCSTERTHLNKLTSLQQTPCEIWWKLVKWFRRRRHLHDFIHAQGQSRDHCQYPFDRKTHVKSGENWSSCFRGEDVKRWHNLYMYLVQGQGWITLGGGEDGNVIHVYSPRDNLQITLTVQKFDCN